MRVSYAVAAAATVAAIGGAVPALAASASTSPAASSAANAIYAATTESAAYQQYFAYAAAADQTGQPDLANVWRTVGEVEHQDHWTHDVLLGGQFQSTDNVVNLKCAIDLAYQAAKADSQWAAIAPAGSAAATELQAVAARETADAALLSQALNAEQGQGTVPAAPAVPAIPVTIAPNPYYTGTFYQDLTGGSDSALEVAAWNWAAYQYFAKVAVDTGQAHLGQLFSGLEAQETQQNWTGISNAAGYVNSNAMNLSTSIASEQGAIDMYNTFAAEATKAGDTATATAFTSIMGDEMGHHSTFATELDQPGAAQG